MYLKIISTHRSATTPLASRNRINGRTEEKEGINGREKRKIDKEWMNQKERSGFRGIWDCFVSDNSINDSNRSYFRNFDC